MPRLRGVTPDSGSSRAFVAYGPRHGAIERLPLTRTRHAGADLDTNAVLLRVDACALSATDGEQWAGHLGAPWPFVPGSEVVGTIEAIGEHARARLGVRAGDRVAVAPRRWCGTCAACGRGRIRRCEHFADAPSVGQVRLAERDGAAALGGLAEQIVLGPGSQLVAVPPALDPVVASGANAVAEAIRWMTVLGEVGEGDVVAVLGPGFRGLAAAAVARDAGARLVAVIGHGPRDAQRLALASAFGADLTIDAATTDPVAALRDATGGGADVVLDITSSSPAAFATAVALAAPEARIVVGGVHGDHDVAGFRPDDLVVRQLRVVGAIGCANGDHARGVALLHSGRWPFASVPTAVVGLDRATVALDSLVPSTTRDPSAPIRTVVVPHDDTEHRHDEGRP
jgi:alcohol dehydrogenase